MTMEPSQDRVRELLDYDPISGILILRNSSSNNRRVAGEEAGHMMPIGYRRLHIDGHRYLAHRIAWIWFYGGPVPEFIDHVNGIRSDNSIKNLRSATRFENGYNRGPVSRNTTGYKGVCWHKASGKWSAAIRVNGCGFHLGLFTNKADAALAYENASKRHHGQFSRITRLPEVRAKHKAEIEAKRVGELV